MSEMLGNQYFLARRYEDARFIFEGVLKSNPGNKLVKKKLIICLAQGCKVEECLKLFYEVISRDVNLIINTDPIKDDCPCPGLIYDFENSHNRFDDEGKRFVILGILWLFCDIKMSLRYFKKAIQYDSKNEVLHSIYTILCSKYVKLNNEEL